MGPKSCRLFVSIFWWPFFLGTLQKFSLLGGENGIVTKTMVRKLGYIPSDLGDLLTNLQGLIIVTY